MTLPSKAEALPGRAGSVRTIPAHFVTGRPTHALFPPAREEYLATNLHGYYGPGDPGMARPVGLAP
jgi:hypothetical protein